MFEKNNNLQSNKQLVRHHQLPICFLKTQITPSFKEKGKLNIIYNYTQCITLLDDYENENTILFNQVLQLTQLQQSAILCV